LSITNVTTGYLRSLENSQFIMGDANLDGVVNALDFTALAADFGSTEGSWNQGDFNNDGIVNALDFNVLATNYGRVLTPASLAISVPEPSTWLPCLIAVSLRATRYRLRHTLRRDIVAV